MGVIRAGDIRQLIISGRELDPAPESNYTIRLGGFENETALTGNRQLHVTQRAQTAGIGDCAISVDPTRQDYEFIEELKNSATENPVTMTLTSGITYSGELVITGELEYNTGEGTLTMELRGRRFEQI